MDNISIYEKNMSVLKEKHPGLYEQLEGRDFFDEPTEINVSIGESDYPFVSVINNENGRQVNLHSRFSPASEAVEIVNSLDLKAGELRFLIGMGFGFLPLEIVRRELPLLKLFIVEKSKKLFFEAIKNMDLTELFEADGVYFFLEGMSDLKPAIYKAEADINILFKGSSITYFEPERELFPDYYAEIGKIIQNEIGHVMCGLNTQKNIGPMFFENLMRNFTECLNSANLGSVYDLWSGKPAMVVGAGPSLSDNIDYIKKYRDKFALFSVDSAVPVLVKNGVIPDLVATVDYHYICFEKYRDVIDKVEEIPLVFAASCATMTLKPYKCPTKFFIAEPFGILGNFAKDWNKWANFGNIEAVSHLALFAARICGSDPIILVGFDLAYVGLRSYAEGTSLTLNIDIESMVWVPDQNGFPVPTDIQMYGQRVLMERQIKESCCQFYNVSNGVAIEGAQSVDLPIFFDSVPDHDEKLRTVLRRAWENSSKPDKESVIGFLKESLKKLRLLSKECSAGMKKAEKARNELEKGKDASLFIYRPLVEKTLELYDGVLKDSAVLDSAITYYQGTDMTLKVDEARLAVDEEKASGVKKISLEMDFVYRALRARNEAIIRLEKIFSSLHGRLLSEKKLLAELERKNSPKKRAEIFVRLGGVYLRYTDYVDAEKTFRIAIEEDEKNAYAWMGLGKTLGEIKKHADALDCLRKAHAIEKKSADIAMAFDYEKKYPDRILDQAERYLLGIDPGIMGNVRENWAIRFCDDILSVYPENERAKKIKANALEKIEKQRDSQSEILPYLISDYEESIKSLDTIIDIKPEIAKKALKILQKHRADDPRILIDLGLIHKKEGNANMAKKCFIQARSLAPQSYEPKIHLASILSEENNYEEALIHLEQAYVVAPDDLSPYLLESIGDLKFEMGNYSDALSIYEKFFVAFPQRKDVLHKIGNCYSELGFNDAASYAWELSEKEDS